MSAWKDILFDGILMNADNLLPNIELNLFMRKKLTGKEEANNKRN